MAAVNTKASLEITKGATVLDPIPLDVSESNSVHDEDERLLGPFPTEEEWATLPRVPGRIPWTAWTVASVEFVERFSYYGTSAVFVNFIQRKLPPGSKTGAGFLIKPGSGALGMGQRASTGMTTCKYNYWYLNDLLADSPKSINSGLTSHPCSVPGLLTSTGDVTRPFK
jgi:POT family proton-dependent oligopeptide transporter